MAKDKNGKINPENKTVTTDRPTVTIDGREYNINVYNYDSAKMAMAIRLQDAVTGEAYMTVTKNFGNFSGNMSFVQKDSSFVDENNAGDVLPFVYKALNAEPYTRFGTPIAMETMFGDYPLIQFNSDKLREFDPDGYEKYVNTWKAECVTQQNKMSDSYSPDSWEIGYEDEDDEYADEGDIFGL